MGWPLSPMPRPWGQPSLPALRSLGPLGQQSPHRPTANMAVKHSIQARGRPHGHWGPALLRVIKNVGHSGQLKEAPEVAGLRCRGRVRWQVRGAPALTQAWHAGSQVGARSGRSPPGLQPPGPLLVEEALGARCLLLDWVGLRVPVRKPAWGMKVS